MKSYAVATSVRVIGVSVEGIGQELWVVSRRPLQLHWLWKLPCRNYPRSWLVSSLSLPLPVPIALIYPSCVGTRFEMVLPSLTKMANASEVSNERVNCSLNWKNVTSPMIRIVESCKERHYPSGSFSYRYGCTRWVKKLVSFVKERSWKSSLHRRYDHPTNHHEYSRTKAVHA